MSNTPGDLIRQARKAAGISQGELAEEISLDRSVLSRIESGEVAISPQVYQRLTLSLRSLNPAALLTAMGYPITVPPPGRLPRQLVQDLLALPPEQLAAIALLVEGLANGGQGGPATGAQ